MGSWTVYNFECADVVARDALLARIEAHHPVTVPSDGDSVFADVDTGSAVVGADYAWADRYLYVTVMESADVLFQQTVDLWDRAAKATFDGATETATDVTFVADTEPGGDDEVEASQFHGMEGLAGLDVVYGLAMLFEFRFRAYAAASPTTQLTPHLGAFDTPRDVVGHLDEFIEEMADRTAVDPTPSGRSFLGEDPALDRHRHRSATPAPDVDAPNATPTADGDAPNAATDAGGEADTDGNAGADTDDDAEPRPDDTLGRGNDDGSGDRTDDGGEPGGAGVDAIHVVDGSTGEVETYENPGDVPADSDDDDAGLMERFRQLLGDR